MYDMITEMNKGKKEFRNHNDFFCYSNTEAKTNYCKDKKDSSMSITKAFSLQISAHLCLSCSRVCSSQC